MYSMTKYRRSCGQTHAFFGGGGGQRKSGRRLQINEMAARFQDGAGGCSGAGGQ